jgi:thioester reductase-like protein
MATFVALFALIVAWLALVRSRRSEEAVQRLRRDTGKLMQRQQQLLQELHPEQFRTMAADPEVEEIEITAPGESTPEPQPGNA